MLARLLPAPLLAIAGALLFGGSVVLYFLCFIPPMLAKLAVPHAGFRDRMTGVLLAIADHWGGTLRKLFALYGVRWDVVFQGRIERGRTYILVANHQSWLDIPVLAALLHGRSAFPRFFLKRELIWVPIIGVACWAMEFPFMKRHSREAVARNPELAREDLEVTRRACQRFARHPATIVNFLEGTRFTEAKRIARGSPYRHLLRPKAGGFAYALDTLSDQLAGIIDVTIVYQPTRWPLLLSFLLGEQRRFAIHVEVLPVPPHLRHGDYLGDPAFREAVQHWVNRLWKVKDQRIARMLADTLDRRAA